MPIQSYLSDSAVFEPSAIQAMSEALERACTALQVNGRNGDRQVIATRIIDLARDGLVDAQALSDRVISETRAMRSL
jgi:hypothetical protein